jgi:hypothetical protein
MVEVSLPAATLHLLVFTSWTMEKATWAPACWDAQNAKQSDKRNVRVVCPADIGACLVDEGRDIERDMASREDMTSKEMASNGLPARA